MKIDMRRRGVAVRAEGLAVPDGDLGKACWRQVPVQWFRSLRSFETWVDWAVRYRTPPLPGGLSRVQAIWDEGRLVLGFRCRKLFGLRQPWVGGDGVQIHLQPGEDGPLHTITVADEGTVRWPGGDGTSVSAAARGDDTYFDLEVAIPFSALGCPDPVTGTVWQVNFMRTEQPLREPTAWSSVGSHEGHSPATGHLTFGEGDLSYPVLSGTLLGAAPQDGVVIESPAGVCFPDESGAFRIEGLAPGPVGLRIGSFHHGTITRLLELPPAGLGLPPVELVRDTDEAIWSRIEMRARVNSIRYEARYEDDPVHRDYQSCPSICVAPDGTLLVTYTCYSGEDQHNAVIVDSSVDGGNTWRQEFVVKQGLYRSSWGNLWVDPQQRVWLFFQHWLPGYHNLHYTRCDAFRPGARDWLEPRRLCEALSPPETPIRRSGAHSKGTFHKFINKPVVLADGIWLAPVESNEWPTRSVHALISLDQGNTWKVRGEAMIQPEHREISEPMVVERRDGTLWLLIRSVHGMAESVSRDGGHTWSPFVRSAIPHCSSRFYLGRLASGRLLLVKHGHMRKTIGREDLTALLSDDDGRTWPYALLLRKGACTYPDVDQDVAGRIHVVYDCGRKGYGVRILYSVLREADIETGALVSPDARLNRVVARTGALRESRKGMGT